MPSNVTTHDQNTERDEFEGEDAKGDEVLDLYALERQSVYRSLMGAHARKLTAIVASGRGCAVESRWG